jgi:hypothetical protein
LPSLVLCQKPHPSPFWPDSYIPNTHIPSTTIILSTTVPSAVINHPKAYYHHLKHHSFLSSTSFVFAETIPSHNYLFCTNQKSCSPLTTKTSSLRASLLIINQTYLHINEFWTNQMRAYTRCNNRHGLWPMEIWIFYFLLFFF